MTSHPPGVPPAWHDGAVVTISGVCRPACIRLRRSSTLTRHAQGAAISYNHEGYIVIRCQNVDDAPFVQDAIAWFILTSILFLMVKSVLRLIRRD